MDRAHLETKYEDTEVKTVSLYVRLPTGELCTSMRIIAENAEQRPIDFEDEEMFSKISCDIARCIWVLFAPAFSIVNSPRSSTSNIVLTHGSIAKEECGKEWVLIRPEAKMRGTTWRCPSVERIGDPLVRG